MTHGITKERLFQFGLEASTAQGTAVAATKVFRGPVASIVDTQEVIFPDENIGYAGQEDRSYIPATTCEYAQSETEATYEQFPVILSASIDDIVAGSVVGSTPEAYSYTYATPTTNSAAAIDSYTLEVGNNAEAYEMEYAFVPNWSLKGASNQALMFSANWRGRQKTSTNFTGALTAPAVEEILFNKGKMYYDSVSVGDTQVTGEWLGFSLNYDAGWKPITTGDGQLYMTLPIFKAPAITGDITIEDATLAATIRTAQAARTTGLLRWLFTGSTTGTGGTYQTKIARVDLAVKWINTPATDSQDDDDVITFPFRVVRTTAVYFTILIVNSLSAIAS